MLKCCLEVNEYLINKKNLLKCLEKSMSKAPRLCITESVRASILKNIWKKLRAASEVYIVYRLGRC